MRRYALALTAAGLGLLIGQPGAAVAAPIGSAVDLDHVGYELNTPVGDRVAVHGFVRSPKDRCRTGRSVRITLDGQELSIASSLADGAFAVKVPFTPAAIDNHPLRVGDYLVSVRRKRIGRPGRRRLCAADSAVFHVRDILRQVSADHSGGGVFEGWLFADESACAAGQQIPAFVSTDGGQSFAFTGSVAETTPIGQFELTLDDPPQPGELYVLLAPGTTLPSTEEPDGGLLLEQCAEAADFVSIDP